MRSPFTRPASAMRARTQSKIAVWTSWGRRARVRDSQEWSGTRSRLSSRRNSRSDRESEQRHVQPALRVDALEVAHQVHAEIAPRTPAPKAPPAWLAVIGPTGRLGEAVETSPSISTDCRRS